jgi:hypothetical protein
MLSSRPKISLGSLCPKLSPSLKLGHVLVKETCAVYANWLRRRTERSLKLSQVKTTVSNVKDDNHQRQHQQGPLHDRIMGMNIKLNIGYASSYLKSRHPLRYVLGGMFREHNRSKVAITCIHIGKQELEMNNDSKQGEEKKSSHNSSTTFSIYNDDNYLDCDHSVQLDGALVALKSKNWSQLDHDGQKQTSFDDNYLNDDNDGFVDDEGTIKIMKRMTIGESDGGDNGDYSGISGLDVLIDIDGYTRDALPGMLSYAQLNRNRTLVTVASL